VKLADTIKGFRDIVNGKYDHFPEQAFYMVGDIESVKVKAEEIAKEVARNKALRGDTDTDESDKKKKGKDAKEEKKVVRDKSSPEYLMPIPRPTETGAEIRVLLKELAEKCEKRDLEYAAKVKLTAIPGELTVGWRFPKEDQIKKIWADWNVLYEQQSDLEGFFKGHFEETAKQLASQREAERKELED
jgi:DNA helicase HerA-like ATPase